MKCAALFKLANEHRNGSIIKRNLFRVGGGGGRNQEKYLPYREVNI